LLKPKIFVIHQNVFNVVLAVDNAVPEIVLNFFGLAVDQKRVVSSELVLDAKRVIPYEPHISVVLVGRPF
jgi:hypothetical protein